MKQNQPEEPQNSPKSSREGKIPALPVDVTLDPATAGPEVILSEDLKEATWGRPGHRWPEGPGQFDTDPCMLGSEGFTSGRHYWEVKANGRFWAVGVARESIQRKGRVLFKPNAELWGLQKYDELCVALTAPSNTSVPLLNGEIGVYLDYEVGQVSFYAVGSRQRIFTFPVASFSDLGNFHADPAGQLLPSDAAGVSRRHPRHLLFAAFPAVSAGEDGLAKPEAQREPTLDGKQNCQDDIRVETRSGETHVPPAAAPTAAPALCPWWHRVLLKVSGLGHLVLLVLVVVLSVQVFQGSRQPTATSVPRQNAETPGRTQPERCVVSALRRYFCEPRQESSAGGCSACSGCKLCPQEWQLHGDRCYWLSKEKGNWTQGKKGCENQEAQLVVLRNKKEKKSLKIITGTQTVWVGLLSSPKELRWVDNTSFNAKTWGSLQKTDEGCGTLKEELEVDICDDEHKWVCQKDPFQLSPSTADGEKCDGAV
ncbi:uncharacterized protein LOC141936917 isoform X2 [Strix uralensis]|uniref:uncharacterized protein LOC141936917 isoform X2 n=1 Tax=Strix uralensis TaxID=36305 RepID=UPI003DA7687D